MLAYETGDVSPRSLLIMKFCFAPSGAPCDARRSAPVCASPAFRAGLLLACTLLFTAHARADSTVVFNEIMYHPNVTNEAQLEWIELHNQIAVDMDLSGWSLAGGVQFTFAEGTVVGGGKYLLIASSPAPRAAGSGATNVLGPFTGRLSNSGDTLELRNNNQRLMDSVSYGVDGDWPVASDGAGPSLAKYHRHAGSALAANWRASAQVGGTPGRENFPVSTTTLSNSLPITLTSSWKYNASGNDLGTAWRDLGYNDSTWSSGSAVFIASNTPPPLGDFESIPTLVNSGLDTARVPLAPGAFDPHYQLTLSAQSAPPPPAIQATVMQNNGAWLANDASSVWIGAISSGNANAAAGPYNFRTTFDLTGYSAIGASLLMNFSVDNDLTNVLLNGVAKDIAFSGFGGFSPNFTLTNGFNSGTNTLDFLTVNASTSANPAGFRVKVSGSARRNVTVNTALPVAPVTYYFRDRFVVNGSPAATGLRLRTILADGAVFYLNGTEVLRFNLPGGAITAATTAVTNITNATLRGPFDLPTGSLLSGTNVLAVEVHRGPSAPADAIFGAELTISTTNFPAPPPPLIVFNEIESATNAGFGFELINYGSTTASLDGCTVARFGGTYHEYTFSGLSLPPGGLVFVPKATLGFSAASGDQFVLYAPGRSNVLDAVVAKKYGRSRLPDGIGPWLVATQTTPGASNVVALHSEIVINEIMYDHRPLAATAASFAPTNIAISITNLWRYHQQGIDLGTAWRQTDYNDASWSSGRALLYVSTASLPAAKNTALSLTAPGGARLITWYFRAPFVFTGDVSSATLSLRSIIDDGVVFYLNGTEVLRQNMVAGNIAYTNLASASVATPVYTGPFSIPNASLVLGTNWLAAEVHQFTTNPLGADVVFGAELTATSFIAPAQPQRDSPEAWIELFNRSTNAVSLAGWKLSDGISFNFATNQTLAPGGYLVVAKDPAFLQALYPALTPLGPYGKSLSHSGDRLLLEDPLGNPADEVHYYANGRWPRFAHAGGSSLELRDPRADNAQAEVWAASDEGSKSTWATYTYRGIAAAETAPSPTTWKEFVLGLLDAGEVLLDDISVIDQPAGAATQLIQNGNFESGLTGWRVLGDHHGSVIVDPANGANHVLRLVATSSTEHMHNHVETTLAGGASVINGHEYEISFRAKWIGGNNALLTRLYFNRLPRVTQLAVPALNGTPGAINSRYATNVGPTYTGFAHTPAVPAANDPVPVFVNAADSDGVTNVALRWSANGGAWNQTTMVAQTSGGYLATVPGQEAGTLVQFYVEGTDALGAKSTYPAAGTNSRALFRVNDGAAVSGALHNIRILMTDADTTLLHAPTNVMSNDGLGATVIDREEQVFYDVNLHLQGSERGRNDSSRVGFTISFQPDDLFRGVHEGISIDRSGGYSGLGGKHDEILLKHMINHAGGLPGMYDDLIHVIAPRVQDNSTGLMMMAKYGDVFLDSQYANGGNGDLFKLELIYYPLSTVDGNVQSFKLPNPDDVLGVDFQDLGNDQESYRWNYIKENNQTGERWDQIMAFNKMMSLNGTAIDGPSQRLMDVSEWARAFAFESLFGMVDSYGFGLGHNFIVYFRPSDGKALAFPWDMDFNFVQAINAPLLPGANVTKLFNLPANQRLYYSHLYDLITTTYNTTYMSRWTTHYGGLVGQNWSGTLGYIGSRASYVLGQLPTATAFAITSNGGNDFTTNNNLIALGGTAPIQAEFIEVNGTRYAITWTSTTTWTLSVPIVAATNALALQAFDRYGRLLTNVTDSITVVDTSAVPSPRGFVVINEIHYHATNTSGGFVEIHNTHPTVAFDFSNWRLDGAGFVFPEGAVLLAGGFLVVASDTNVFSLTFPNAPLPVGHYSGNLQNSGELLQLMHPLTTNTDELIDAVRYDDQLPWPVSADGTGPSLQLIDPTLDNERPGNWAAAIPTPGATNSVRASLVAFPPLWINELLVFNTNGVFDNFGLREPWLELFNAGTNTVSLQGLFLTDNYSNLKQWPFPAGASLAPREFRVIWADGDIAQTVGTNLHTSFRLTNNAGSLALVRTNAGRTEVLDYVNYFGLTPNRSFGSAPDGQLFDRQIFYFVTHGASNNPASAPVPVMINEFMADNAGPGGLRDPVDGLFQDWFELYNPNTNTFDLSGHFLTDTLSNPTKWQIPLNTFIAAHGFLLVWADNQPEQNGLSPFGDLHANFQLSTGGEAIGLFAPDGTLQSSVVFGPQIQNVSMGLFPEGSTNGGYSFMTNFTPRTANSTLPAPSAFSVAATLLTTNSVWLAWPSLPGRTYRVEFKAALEDAAWSQLGGDLTTSSSTYVLTNAPGTITQRFYRVLLVR